MSTPLCAEESAVFIWNRGGFGHYSVKEARKSEWLEGKKDPIVYDVDLFGEGFLNDLYIGDASILLWNKAQQDGNIMLQKFFLNSLGVAHVLFHPIIYYKTKQLLLSLDKEPDVIVSTQALCVTAVLQAIKSVNKLRNWNMHLDLQMIEMPTEQPTYLFKSLARIKNRSGYAKLLTVKSFKPYIKSGMSEEAFWKKHCGKISVDIRKSLPLRKSFKKVQGSAGSDSSLFLQLNPKDRPSKMGYAIRKEGELEYPVKENERVVTLMLGSEPSKESVLGYLDAIIELASASPSDAMTHFFIYTGAPKNRLRKAIYRKIQGSNMPNNLNIVPFTSQPEENIAPLLARSDVTLTRSGAATTMELLALHTPKKLLSLIHAEGYGSRQALAEKSKELGRREAMRVLLLEEGINPWEAGNAEYLEREIGAQIVHPECVKDSLLRVWRE